MMPKLLRPFLILNWRILDLIWRATAYFAQHNPTIILPRATLDEKTIELLEAGDPYLAPNSLEKRMFNVFRFFFQVWDRFWSYKFIFVNIQCRLLLTCIWRIWSIQISAAPAVGKVALSSDWISFLLTFQVLHLVVQQTALVLNFHSASLAHT